MSELIDQINFLAKKAKEEGLTEEEKVLQQELRNKYRENFRKNFISQMDNTYIVDEQGNKTKVIRKQ